jgi:hypothetical protein
LLHTSLKFDNGGQMGTKLDKRLIVLAVVCIAVIVTANAQTTGILTIGGQDGMIQSCTQTGNCTGRIPISGGLYATFTSPIAGQSFTVSVGYSGQSTAQALAQAMCAALTSEVKCTGISGDSSGVWSLYLTSTSVFSTSVANRFTSGGRGSVQVFCPCFGISPPNWVVVQPKYYVVELLYAPPGNTSSAGFTNSTTQSTMTSVGSNFQSGTSEAFQVSLGFGGDRYTYGQSSGTSSTTSSTSAFSESLQTSTGSTLKSIENPIDHTQDQFWLLLNPEIAIVQTSTNSVSYGMSTINNEYPDIVNLNVAEMLNPSLIPLSVLETQTDPTTGGPLPGLKNICALPLPDNQCTSANACGCVASDFSVIVGLDELRSNPNQNPVTVDTNRFKYVSTITLEGPACSTCDPVTNTYAITDSTLASETTGYSQAYSVAYSAGTTVSSPLGIASVSDTFTQSFQWTDSISFGSSNGTAHAETVTLGTSGVSCYQQYDVYQDGVFHTFAYYPVSPSVPAC